MSTYNSSAIPIDYSSLSSPIPVGPNSALGNPTALVLMPKERPLQFEGASVNIIDNKWKEINPDQLWYWTPGWQAQESEAELDIQFGRYEEFASMDDFINSLKGLMADE